MRATKQTQCVWGCGCCKEAPALKAQRDALLEAAKKALGVMVAEWNDCGGGSKEHQEDCVQCRLRSAIQSCHKAQEGK